MESLYLNIAIFIHQIFLHNKKMLGKLPSQKHKTKIVFSSFYITAITIMNIILLGEGVKNAPYHTLSFQRMDNAVHLLACEKLKKLAFSLHMYYRKGYDNN